MYPEFNAEKPESLAARKKRRDLEMLPNPSLAANGFNIWWQRTAAQNRSMVLEASDLMRAHRLISSAHQAHARQAH